jgi:uracil-DNA glycosylase family protein
MPRPPPPDDPVPDPTKPNLDACRRCELWENATQAVPGGGGKSPRLMLVGEQPGDEEDKQGAPFVGAAGQLLRRAIADAGLTLDEIYLTNAVKHFYWEPRGPRRIHKTPAQRHIDACRAWLEKEIAKMKPLVIVALGSTALNGVMGGKMKVSDAREENLEHASGAAVVATYHPSAALRIPDSDGRAQMYATIVDDLKKARRLADAANR